MPAPGGCTTAPLRFSLFLTGFHNFLIIFYQNTEKEKNPGGAVVRCPGVGVEWPCCVYMIYEHEIENLFLYYKTSKPQRYDVVWNVRVQGCDTEPESDGDPQPPPSRPEQLSTYALTLYKHTATVEGKAVLVGLFQGAFLLLIRS